jgi:hypothetical protein
MERRSSLMKKLLFMVLVFFILSILYSNAADEYTRLELVRLANKELIESGILMDDYFEEININGKGLSTNPYLSGLRNYIVYGNPHGDFKDDRYRYLGYTFSDANFTNFMFPNDVISTTGLWNRNWIEDPKNNPRTMDRSEVKGTDTFNNNPLYEESIKEGLRLISRKDSNGNLIDFPEDELKKRQWHKYVHIYQPPTSVSWGCGIMFHNPSGTNINYLTVPLSPEGLKGDLNVEFEEIPSSMVTGDKVQVLIQIKSTYKTNLTEADGNAPSFKWEITDKATNMPIPSVNYYGYVEKDAGNLEILANGETALVAEFEMPEKDVHLKFEINKDGKSPSETFLDNNVLETVITPALKIEESGDFILDYNVLSRKVRFPLAGGKNITARLSAPEGKLIDDAWGALNIYNISVSLFRDFEDKKLTVNEPAGTIIKNPIIDATLQLYSR